MFVPTKLQGRAQFRQSGAWIQIPSSGFSKSVLAPLRWTSLLRGRIFDSPFSFSPCPDLGAFCSERPEVGFRLEPVSMHLRLFPSFSDASHHRQDMLLQGNDGVDSSGVVRTLAPQVTTQSRQSMFSPRKLIPVPDSGPGSDHQGSFLLETEPLAALPDSIESLAGQSLMDGSSSCPSGGSSTSTQSFSSFSFLGFSPRPQQETVAPSEAGDPLFSSDDRDFDDLSIQSDLPQALPFEQWAATLGSREDVWVRGLVSSGIDRDIASLIPNCHKDSTKRQYESAWKK